MNFSSAPVFMDPSQSWNRRCTPKTSTNGNIGSHPKIELYDLIADPYELTDVADDPQYATARDELLSRLSEWMGSTRDPLLDGAVTSPLHTNAAALLD
jgi:N-sulfoglucosamine sulfohydrolase